MKGVKAYIHNITKLFGSGKTIDQIRKEREAFEKDRAAKIEKLREDTEQQKMSSPSSADPLMVMGNPKAYVGIRILPSHTSNNSTFI